MTVPTAVYLGAGWSLVEHLAGLDQGLLALARTPDGLSWALTPAAAEARRLLTLADPLLFGWLYLQKHLRGPETGDRVSFSRFHLDMLAEARTWLVPATRPAQHRTAYVAPRSAGKSTLAFLIIPLWAAAHLVVDFIAAFADSSTQAELHLTTLKRELDTNALLRHDFPGLVTPARRPGGTSVSDNRGLLLTASGFAFAAKGIDSSSLGMKVGERRPRVLLLDDIEPDESNNSAGQTEKRLATILDAVFPLNINARVVMVGTTTMAGSVMHDIARQTTEPGSCPAWVAEENIVTRYYPAIVTADDGTEHSLWPERWSLDYLLSIRHTRAFAKNMMNDPMGADGQYWAPDDFAYGLPAAPLTHQLLSIDPAVTTKGKSDFTGLAVVGFSKPGGVCVVRWARAVKIPPGAELRAMVLRLIEQWPDVAGVVVESNQGGDAWRSILHGLPVGLRTVHQSEPKDVRAARLLNHYQRRRVLHEERIPALEQQMVAYPKGPNDDLVDAVGTAVAVFLGKKAVVGVTSASYV